MMRSRIILFIVGYIVWALLTWPVDIQQGIVGIVVVAFISFLTGDLFTPLDKFSYLTGFIRRPHHFGHIKRYLWFLYYVPMFLWECLKANIDVMLRVLNPRLPINPGIVKIRTTLKSDTGLTFLANSITLTPGTFCIDIDAEKGILYIHWIDVKTQDIDKATQEIASKFENILKRIFE